jgi:NAD(P)-dependent dehydrogenase (short-subunit alcohol dehydrogenase family)
VATTQKLVEVTPEDFDYIFDVNVRGAFFVAQEVGKRMIARAQGAAPGTFTGGRIVNVASVAGLRVLGRIGAYAMSKAAVIHMTKAMAVEWGRYGINVNALCPGYIDTEINHHQWQTDSGKKFIDSMPRKRIGAPDFLDTTLLMLCANESHFINGAVISADDGFGL